MPAPFQLCILLHNIEGKVDFKEILIKYCKNFNNSNPVLTEDEFNEIFSKIDVKFDDISDIKRITIDEYNSNKINKEDIESRFKYHVQRKIRQSNQLERLKDIINSTNVPEMKIYLKEDELNDIYDKTKEKILSEHGLNSIVLDYVRFKINNQIKVNQSKALLMFNKLKDEGILSDFDDNQRVNFVNKFELLIKNNQIKKEDITQEFIEKVSAEFLASGNIEV